MNLNLSASNYRLQTDTHGAKRQAAPISFTNLNAQFGTKEKQVSSAFAITAKNSTTGAPSNAKDDNKAASNTLRKSIAAVMTRNNCNFSASPPQRQKQT